MGVILGQRDSLIQTQDEDTRLYGLQVRSVDSICGREAKARFYMYVRELVGKEVSMYSVIDIVIHVLVLVGKVIALSHTWL